jgi:probable addiction module antidote protein
MAVKTHQWDPAEHLDNPEAIVGYLEAVFEDGDPKLIVAALGDVARASGMSALARETGLSRENLYRALSAEGNPEFSTVVKVLRAFGVTLEARATPPKTKPGRKRTTSGRPSGRAA